MRKLRFSLLSMKKLLLMRFLLSLSLCFYSCSSTDYDLDTARFERQSGHSSSALKQIANDFSILARVVNGIALQEGLSDGSADSSVVIAELFNIESGNTVRNLLDMTLDTSGISSRLETMLADVSHLGVNPLTDSAKVRDGILALNATKDNVADLKSGSDADVEAFIRESKEITSVPDPLMEFHEFDAVTNYLKTVRDVEPNVDDLDVITQFHGAIKKINESRSSFAFVIQTFQNYEKNPKLKKLWNITRKYMVLDPILKISKAAQAYRDNWVVLSSLSAKLETLKTDVTVLLPLIEQNEFHDKLGESLKPITSLVTELSTSKTTDRMFTEGFPNGRSDLTMVEKDLRSSWFKEKMAEGRNVSKLSSEFSLVEKLAGEVGKVENDWNSFKKSSDVIELITQFSTVFKILAENGKLLEQNHDLTTSVSTLTGAMTNLTEIKATPPLEAFDKLYGYCSKISEYSERFEKAFKKMEQIGFTRANEAFDKLEEISKNAETKNKSKVFETAGKMKSVVGFNELVEIALIAKQDLKPLLTSEISTLLNEKSDWTSIASVQKSLSGTGYRSFGGTQ